MAADFTIGKWTCHFMPEEFRVKGNGCIITADDNYIATVQNNNDGKLIAEAPNMYTLLIVLNFFIYFI